MMPRLFAFPITVAAAVLLFASSARAEAPADPWQRWKWLLGEWKAEAKPGEPTGGFSLAPDLDGKVLVRKNEATYPAAKDRPASTHRDLMVIYPAGDATKATYWDNEGHVIVYSVAVDADRIVLTSDPAPGPRFRLSYQRKSDALVAILFEIAPPNAPGEFKKYLEATVKRSK